MHRLLRLVAALALVASLAPLPASVGAQQKPLRKMTLMLNWYPYGEHAAFYYGVEKGYYRSAGIDLTIEAGGGSSQTVQAVAAGKVDFGYADAASIIRNVAAGAGVKSIGVMLQTTPASVEFFADKNWKTIADVKGHSVAGSPGDAAYETLNAVLEANHIAPESVQRINVDPAGKLAAVISGRADSLAGFYNDQAPTIAARTSRKVNVLRYADYGVNFFGTGLLASDDMIKKDPAVVKAFMHATIKAWDDAAKHRPEAVAAEEKLAEKPPAADVLAHQFDETLALLHTPATKSMPPGVNSEKDWQTTIGVVSKYLGVKNPGPPSAYWDGSIAR